MKNITDDKLSPYSDWGRVVSLFARMSPGFKEEHPPCIDSHGHYFKTCGQCFTMICRRCQYKTIDFVGQMSTTYGDFSGTHAPYDRYCSKCEVLLQRGYDGWKCYEDYEADRISKKDFVCRSCEGVGWHQYKYEGCNDPEKKHTCGRCEGTGVFPSPYRKKQIEQGKKITEIIDEPLWKRTKDWIKIFVHNYNPWSIGTIRKRKKFGI